MKIIIRHTDTNRSGNRGYDTTGDRNRAIAALRLRGYNHFVCYRDTRADFALQYGTAAWCQPGHIYVNR